MARTLGSSLTRNPGLWVGIPLGFAGGGEAGTALILKNAVQPRINTDGHEYQAFTENQRFTRRVNLLRLRKPVFIHSSVVNDCFVRFQLRNLG